MYASQRISCTVYYVQTLPKLGEREAIGVIYPVSLPLSSAPWTIQDLKAEIYRMQRHPSAPTGSVEELELILPSEMVVWNQTHNDAFFFFEESLTYDEFEDGDLVVEGGVYYMTRGA